VGEWAVRALVWLAPKSVELRNEPEPVARDDECIVTVLATGVCGSDLNGVRGLSSRRIPPLILGHEATVRADTGELFVAFPLSTCGRCDRCLEGAPNLCGNRSLLGLDRPGTFAERVAVSVGNLVPVPLGLGIVPASLTEPLATAMHVARQEGVSAGRTVLVIGCGSIGLLATYAFSRLGATVHATDPVAGRRAVASLLGADSILPSRDEIRPQTYDIIFDAVGIPATWSLAVASVRTGGSIAVVGLGQSEGLAPMGAVVQRGLTLRGYYAYTRDDFDAALKLLAISPPQTGWVRQVGLEEGAGILLRLVDDPALAAKVMFLTTAGRDISGEPLSPAEAVSI
jgi:threonine dehydrogenase-like Zn-dependent dehydrogenase